MNIKKVKKNGLDDYVKSDHQKKKKQKLKQNKTKLAMKNYWHMEKKKQHRNRF